MTPEELSIAMNKAFRFFERVPYMHIPTGFVGCFRDLREPGAYVGPVNGETVNAIVALFSDSVEPEDNARVSSLIVNVGRLPLDFVKLEDREVSAYGALCDDLQSAIMKAVASIIGRGGSPEASKLLVNSALRRQGWLNEQAYTMARAAYESEKQVPT